MRAETSGLLSGLGARKQLGQCQNAPAGLKGAVHPSWTQGLP